MLSEGKSTSRRRFRLGSSFRSMVYRIPFTRGLTPHTQPNPRATSPVCPCLVLSVCTFTRTRGFLREVAKAGRSAGLRPGPLASIACDSLCFRDTPWAGSVYGYTNTNTIVGASDRSSDTSASSWQDHREVFRAVLGSFVSATR